MASTCIAQGLFPQPRTNPPDEADIKRAEGFRDKRYRRLTDMAFQASARGSKYLADFLRMAMKTLPTRWML